jgi:hypothetical protein
VASAAAFPNTPQVRIRVGSELLLVTAVSGTTWTVTRGLEGTTAAAHAAGSSVTQVLTAAAVAGLAGVGAANTFATGTQTFQTGAAGTVGMVVKGAASQTANLQEWQDSSGNPQLGVDASQALFARKAGGTAGVHETQLFQSGNNSCLVNRAGDVDAYATLSIGVAGSGDPRCQINKFMLWFQNVFSASLLYGDLDFGPSSVLAWHDANIHDATRTLALQRSASGVLSVTGGTATTWGAVNCGAPAASTVALAVAGTASQAANLTEWKNSSGTVLATISPDGGLTCAEISGHRSKIASSGSTSINLNSADTGQIFETTSGSAVSITLAASAAVGTSITLTQAGAGQVTFAAASGGSLRNRQSHTKTAGQWGVVSLYVRTNSGGSAAEWVLSGDTTA